MGASKQTKRECENKVHFRSSHLTILNHFLPPKKKNCSELQYQVDFFHTLPKYYGNSNVRSIIYKSKPFFIRIDLVSDKIKY